MAMRSSTAAASFSSKDKPERVVNPSDDRYADVADHAKHGVTKNPIVVLTSRHIAHKKISQLVSSQEKESPSDASVKSTDSGGEVSNGIQRIGLKKGVCGDVFGLLDARASMLGMLYRSRIQGAHLQQAKVIKEIHREHDSNDDGPSQVSDDSKQEDESEESDIENEPNVDKMNPRLRLAVTVKNWSLKPENDNRILAEGAVHALIALTGVNDTDIRLNCIIALYNLSSREVNREELLSIGATNGIYHVCRNMRNWRVAKLCAMSLGYLSEFQGMEDVMSREGGVSALQGIVHSNSRNQRLAPICLQTLYNLTCVPKYYKNLERIPKTFLTLPPLAFDSTLVLLRVLVNSSRFSETRLKIIEDGIVQTFIGVVNTLSSRSNRSEIVLLLSESIRNLSESIPCRSELISKGTIEVISQMLVYVIDDESRLLTIKAIHNLIQAIHGFPGTIFEVAVLVVCEIGSQSDNDHVLQITSACIWNFVEVKLRNFLHLSDRVCNGK